MKKIIKISLSVVILLVLFSGLKFFLSKDIFNIQTKIYKKYPNLKNDFRKNLFKETSVIENLKNDYNFKFLPDTQFIKLNLSSKKLLFSEKFLANHNDKKKLGGYKHRFKSFFFDQFKEKILLTDYLGGTYEFDLKSLSNTQVNQINLTAYVSTNIFNTTDRFFQNNGYHLIADLGTMDNHDSVFHLHRYSKTI